MLEKKYSYIAIDGLIGTGKTHLTKLLAKKLNATAIYEDFVNNPFLEQFYANPQHYSLPTQLFFLLNRYQQIVNLSQTDLFKTCSISDYTLEKNDIFASVTLNENELGLYYKIRDLMKENVTSPDLILFLQAEIPFLLQRIRKRGFAYERSITEQYLKLLNEAYNQYFFHIRGIPILVINITNLDFTENSDDFNWLLTEINKPIGGIKYINPG
ncbi:deoxynucleoside kinase [candidate division KSB1 bacterium]